MILKTAAVAVAVNVIMWVKQRWQKLRLYPHFNISVLALGSLFLVLPKALAHFFLIQGGKRRQKSLFLWLERFGEALAKMVLLWSFFSKNGTTESILHNLKL